MQLKLASVIIQVDFLYLDLLSFDIEQEGTFKEILEMLEKNPPSKKIAISLKSRILENWMNLLKNESLKKTLIFVAIKKEVHQTNKTL